jgi:hypothetical protein
VELAWTLEVLSVAARLGRVRSDLSRIRPTDSLDREQSGRGFRKLMLAMIG